MRLQLVLNKREIEALRAMSREAASNAEVMISDGKEGGQLKLGYQIEEGIAILAEIIGLANAAK